MTSNTLVYAVLGRIYSECGSDETWIHSVHASEESAYEQRATLIKESLQNKLAEIEADNKVFIDMRKYWSVASYELIR
jgi:hypothetical protein